jgi:hypothetical protein
MPRALTRRFLVPLAAALVAAAAAGPSPAAAAPARTAADTGFVLGWYDQTQAAVVASGITTQVSESRIWADAWLAAARALDPTYRNVRFRQKATYQWAATATSIHDILAALVPQQRGTLDAALLTTLSYLRNGPARQAGISDGHLAAQRVFIERASDGLDVPSVNTPFPTPSPQPGLWQPTPPTNGPAVQAGEGNAKTFLLGTADRFEPPPPPALGSDVYDRDLAEVDQVGAKNSTVRTPAQTAVAGFWTQPSLSAYVQVLRAAVADGTHSLRDTVRMVAAFHAITIDAQIAAYQAKFHYLFWRPVTAIHAGNTGDPQLKTDPKWTPLITTPLYPDYPSGHSTYAGAAQAVLTRLLGPNPPAPFVLTSFASASGPILLSYGDGAWAELTQENIDARVWEGIHFRNTDEVGAQLGAQVANYDLPLLSRLL